MTDLGIQHLGLFIATGILLNLTPGPDVLYIVGHAMRRGLRAGFAASLGIAAGCCVHVAAAALGVGALIAASATAFTVLKWAGAAYLVWMGLRALFGRTAPNAMENVAAWAVPERLAGQFSFKTVCLGGFGTNVLNPKVAVFFLAFVPQFIAPGAPQPALAFGVLGLLFVANGLWVCIGWALAGAWLAQRPAVQRGLGPAAAACRDRVTRRSGWMQGARAPLGSRPASAGNAADGRFCGQPVGQASCSPPCGVALLAWADAHASSRALPGGLRLACATLQAAAAGPWLDRIAGLLFIGFGVRLAVSELPR